MLLKIKNEEETRRFGLSLASQLMPGDIVCLTGDLGTGKTALTKAIAEGLGVTAVSYTHLDVYKRQISC